MSAIAIAKPTPAWDNLEHATDDELCALIQTVQNLLIERKVQRQKAAKQRAQAILKEAGLDARIIRVKEGKK